MRRIRRVCRAAVVVASLVLPFRAVAGDERPDPVLERLMKAKMEVSGKAGALKQQLTKQNPDALQRYEEIVKLRARVERLNSEIDEILCDRSAKYRRLLREKEQLDRRYQEAKEASAEKGGRGN